MPVTILYNQTHLVHSSVLSQDVEFLADVSFFHVPYGYLVPKMNMPLTVIKMFESVSDVNSAQGSYPHINDIVPYGRHEDQYRDWETDRKSTRLNSSHSGESRMPSSA